MVMQGRGGDKKQGRQKEGGGTRRDETTRKGSILEGGDNRRGRQHEGGNNRHGSIPLFSVTPKTSPL